MSCLSRPRRWPRPIACAVLAIAAICWQSSGPRLAMAQAPANKTDANKTDAAAADAKRGKSEAKPDAKSAAKADPTEKSATPADDLAEKKFQDATAAQAHDPSSASPKTNAESDTTTATDWLSVAAWWGAMLFKGGPLMIPIGLLSLVAMAFTIERLIGLRRNRVIPRRFVREMRALAAAPGGFDPRKAYRLCQQFPSSASNVARALLLKAGRSTPELDHSIKEAVERENWRLNFNVRPLLLAVSAAPLLGLLGTVCGMIIAFFRTANAPVGQDRALVLADGIYLKLITTMGGLAVAIPALIVAFYFEGRIQRLLHEIEDLVHAILPQVERFEGKLKVSRTSQPGVEPPPVAKLAQVEALPVEMAGQRLGPE